MATRLGDHFTFVSRPPPHDTQTQQPSDIIDAYWPLGIAMTILSSPCDTRNGIEACYQVEASSLLDKKVSILPNKKMKTSSTPAWLKVLLSILHMDLEAFQFAVRMAVVLTVSALFVLVRLPGNREFPNGLWVYVTVLNVSWFPTLRDAASVFEKMMQRWLGTMLGALLGMTCGFLSLPFDGHSAQATFLGFCTFFMVFAVVAISGQVRIGRTRMIQAYSYATCLCLLTFGIAMMPFLRVEEPKWENSVLRMVNVTIGCVVGALGSVLVWPRSTTAVLHTKTERQVRLAGEACESVLHTAAGAFSGRIQIQLLSTDLVQSKKPLKRGGLLYRMLRRSSTSSVDPNMEKVAPKTLPGTLPKKVEGLVEDVTLEKYEDAIEDWKACKALFPLLSFDPFNFGVPNDATKAFHNEISVTLARSLRIQTTIVVMDGMIRNDATYNFEETDLIVFAETGSLIRELLTLPLEASRCHEAAEKLFVHLEHIRRSIFRISAIVAQQHAAADALDPVLEVGIMDFRRSFSNQFHSSNRMDDDEGRGVPKYAATSGNNNVMLFLQLVEHLILRSLRLYHSWQIVQDQTLSEDLSTRPFSI